MKKRELITVPNELLFEQVVSVLQQGKSVIIPVKGGSMVPFLRNGERVVLQPFHKNDLKLGGIVLAKHNNKIILHRVVRIEKTILLLAGDANLVQYEQINWENVLAIAVSVFRKEKEVSLTNKWETKTGLLWYWLRPLRRIIKKIL